MSFIDNYYHLFVLKFKEINGAESFPHLIVPFDQKLSHFFKISLIFNF
jgi:hypothetical protein